MDIESGRPSVEGSRSTTFPTIGSDLLDLVVKIHRQIHRNLPSDPEVKEEIRDFLSTDRYRIFVPGSTGDVTSIQILTSTYEDLRKNYNRCNYIRNNISSCRVGPEELERCEREFLRLRNELSLRNDMSQLTSIINHVKKMLEERRS